MRVSKGRLNNKGRHTGDIALQSCSLKIRRLGTKTGMNLRGLTNLGGFNQKTGVVGWEQEKRSHKKIQEVWVVGA